MCCLDPPYLPGSVFIMSGRGKKRQPDGEDPEDGAGAAAGGKAGGGKAGKKLKKLASKKSTQLTVLSPPGPKW